MGDVRQPIPMRLIPAPQADASGPTLRQAKPHQLLVIVLPGRGDSVSNLEHVGIAKAIQKAWPDADVMLTGTALSYYMQGAVWERLHDEIVEPARHQGYTQIWMSGASLGGMGTLLYEQHYPGELRGLVLWAPYLGEKPLLKEIDSAGGLAPWQPGPVPALVDKNNFQRETWRWLQGWNGKSDPAQRVWLGFGEHDKLRYAMPAITPLLAGDHVFVRPGRHAWTTWNMLATEMFQRIRAQQK
ncbi:MAG: alpha/beta hydrolase [Lysobacteraceae bacterium]